MQIKELSKRTNLPTKTIRYYESIYLLSPQNRLENGYRNYSQDVDGKNCVCHLVTEYNKE